MTTVKDRELRRSKKKDCGRLGDSLTPLCSNPLALVNAWRSGIFLFPQVPLLTIPCHHRASLYASMYASRPWVGSSRLDALGSSAPCWAGAQHASRDKTTSRPYVRYRKKGPCQWYTRMAPNLVIREIIGCMYAWAAYA